MNIQLSASELKVLTELVETRIEQLGSEIRHARVAPFKDQLKDYRDTLEGLEARLRAAASSSSMHAPDETSRYAP